MATHMLGSARLHATQHACPKLHELGKAARGKSRRPNRIWCDSTATLNQNQKATGHPSQRPRPMTFPRMAVGAKVWSSTAVAQIDVARHWHSARSTTCPMKLRTCTPRNRLSVAVHGNNAAKPRAAAEQSQLQHICRARGAKGAAVAPSQLSALLAHQSIFDYKTGTNKLSPNYEASVTGKRPPHSVQQNTADQYYTNDLHANATATSCQSTLLAPHGISPQPTARSL